MITINNQYLLLKIKRRRKLFRIILSILLFNFHIQHICTIIIILSWFLNVVQFFMACQVWLSGKIFITNKARVRFVLFMHQLVTLVVLVLQKWFVTSFASVGHLNDVCSACVTFQMHFLGKWFAANITWVWLSTCVSWTFHLVFQKIYSYNSRQVVNILATLTFFFGNLISDISK